MAKIIHISDGESGASVRDKLNKLIDRQGISIPILKLESKRYTPASFDPETDGNLPGKLYASWETDNVEFLNHNPEIWLFIHRKNRRRFKNGDILIKRKFVHPPHLNGVGCTHPAWYSGIATNKFNVPYLTAFECPAISDQSLEIPINPYLWIYYRDGSNDIEINSNTILIDRNYCFSGERESKLFATMKLAIVIDNPDDTANNPKIIGPYSKSFALRIRKAAGRMWDIGFDLDKKQGEWKIVIPSGYNM